MSSLRVPDPALEHVLPVIAEPEVAVVRLGSQGVHVVVETCKCARERRKTLSFQQMERAGKSSGEKPILCSETGTLHVPTQTPFSLPHKMDGDMGKVSYL